MPDQDSKKSQHKKSKTDAKEQRKPRQQRHHAGGQSKSENRTEEPKVPVAASEKPKFEEPGPDFYKGLKRETDDILKITEETNSKYKKKEIQSNWAKYEVPIESYDDIEQQENLGADYEQLIQAPLSLGGHFQFKHEKSWDISTGPSLYDKYFDINMNDLATALCTIPFYERNGIDKSIFTETDIQTMEQRTSRYKHKYFKIATIESEIQNKIYNSLKDECIIKDTVNDERKSESEAHNSHEDDISFDESKSNKTEVSPQEPPQVEIVFKRAQEELKVIPAVEDNAKQNEDLDSIDDIIGGTNETLNIKPGVMKAKPIPEAKVMKKDAAAPAETKQKPVIESPEDLEKWLDDFLEEE